MSRPPRRWLFCLKEVDVDTMLRVNRSTKGTKETAFLKVIGKEVKSCRTTHKNVAEIRLKSCQCVKSIAATNVSRNTFHLNFEVRFIRLEQIITRIADRPLDTITVRSCPVLSQIVTTTYFQFAMFLLMDHLTSCACQLKKWLS